MKTKEKNIDKTRELEAMKFKCPSCPLPHFRKDLSELYDKAYSKGVEDGEKKAKNKFNSHVYKHKNKNRDNGLCWDCNSKRVDKWYCSKHQEEHRRRSREYYHKKKAITQMKENLKKII